MKPGQLQASYDINEALKNIFTAGIVRMKVFSVGKSFILEWRACGSIVVVNAGSV